MMQIIEKILPSIYSPEKFQGNLGKNPHFETWRAKFVTANYNQSVLFTISICYGDNPSCIIQIQDGNSGETTIIEVDTEEFFASKKEFNVSVGKCRLSEKGLELMFCSGGIKLCGSIQFGKFEKYPKSLTSPGIMGPLSFNPFMTIHHAIISMNHIANGDININGKLYKLQNAKGYIEKSWGRFYPKSWTMIQCHTFNVENTSIFFVAAPATLQSKTIQGMLCFLKIGDKMYNLSMYKGAKIENVSHNKRLFFLEVSCQNIRFDATIIPRTYGSLKVPSPEIKEWMMHECLNATLHLNVYKDGEKILTAEGEQTSFDLVGDIFNYLEQITVAV
jgi:tocopherol cyclase